jgi:4-hydroxy-2-oxoheptanedioate aldolase
MTSPYAGLRNRLRSGEVLAGYFAAIPSSASVQAMAAAGADWIVIDQEHGAIGPEAMHAMVAAIAGSPCAALVRVPRPDEAWVKPALDAGAEGILFPLVGSAADAAECVSLVRYPPLGRRGWGPFAAHARWGVGLLEYLPQRGAESLCMLLIETRGAVDDIEAICKVDGVDCVVLAPYDLSTALGIPGRFEAPEFREAEQRVERVVLEAGIPLGGVAMTPERTRLLVERGYRLVAQGVDLLMLGDLVRQAAGWRKAF